MSPDRALLRAALAYAAETFALIADAETLPGDRTKLARCAAEATRGLLDFTSSRDVPAPCPSVLQGAEGRLGGDRSTSSSLHIIAPVARVHGHEPEPE